MSLKGKQIGIVEWLRCLSVELSVLRSTFVFHLLSAKPAIQALLHSVCVVAMASRKLATRVAALRNTVVPMPTLRKVTTLYGPKPGEGQAAAK